MELKAASCRGLADPRRLAILQVLRGGPWTVGKIARRTGLTVANGSDR
ncbi:MAG: ArsR family transcriptional regulator [Thermomicrobium sp.]|nr:ArsR family transcriptional regulator [Thermomicrobium sp.]